MITAEVVYKYKVTVNKLDSQDFIDLPLPTILDILNKTRSRKFSKKDR